MTDPITLGALVATALAAGATEAGKAALGAAAMDAYMALHSAAIRILGEPAERLMEKPDSEHRAGYVAEIVDKNSEAERDELHRLADVLRGALTAEGRGDALMTMFNQFNAYGGEQS